MGLCVGRCQSNFEWASQVTRSSKFLLLNAFLATSFLSIKLALADEVRTKISPPAQVTDVDRLERGRVLLRKLIYVAAEVPLMDVDAVMREFGFKDLVYRTYPKYVSVQVKGKDGARALPIDLEGTGFTSIEVRPWNSPRANLPQFLFLGSFNSREVCLAIEDVKVAFGEPKSLFDVITVDKFDKSSRQHNVSGASYQFPKLPLEKLSGSISFIFEYKTCAESVSLGYSFKN